MEVPVQYQCWEMMKNKNISIDGFYDESLLQGLTWLCGVGVYRNHMIYTVKSLI